MNPTRTGLLDALGAMGARIAGTRAADGGEPAADVTVSASGLVATEVGGALVPRLIDEVPALAVAAAAARGRTVIRDAAELRVKESDRIAALVREFGKMGVRMEERPDGLVIDGPQRFRAGRVASGGDHRMAMALTVAALCADGAAIVEDVDCVATSFPEFAHTVNVLAGTDAVVVEEG